MGKRLRSGYTTGACAAAAAKAAVVLAISGKRVKRVEIPFPDSSRHWFQVCRCEATGVGAGARAFLASVIKDAGDDPDVTNRAEIVASVRLTGAGPGQPDCLPAVEAGIVLCRGAGVGLVTKHGLAVEPGEPAINPVPRRMILQAVLEGLAGRKQPVEVTISIVNGEELAKRTLNHRLGIVGGLSILGTTGIVRPVSAEAWTATIQASLAVAREAGLTEVVLSTGRTSEKGAQGLLDLPEEGYAMMGDYLEFSLKAAAAKGFEKIHLAGMWAKIMKAAMAIPQTHVRHGALDMATAVDFLAGLGASEQVLGELAGVNTAREIYVRLAKLGERELIRTVCEKARDYATKVAGRPVGVCLVNSNSRVIEYV